MERPHTGDCTLGGLAGWCARNHFETTDKKYGDLDNSFNPNFINSNLIFPLP